MPGWKPWRKNLEKWTALRLLPEGGLVFVPFRGDACPEWVDPQLCAKGTQESAAND